MWVSWIEVDILHELWYSKASDEMNESDPRSDVHYLGSSENKA